MAIDWRSAYFAQARSDYETFQLLHRHNAPLCQCLHYLQMTTEKLAKGFRTEPGNRQHPVGLPHASTHNAFVTFMRIAKGNTALRRICRFKQAAQFSAYIDSLLPIAQEIENLAPANVLNAPNPEYPWDAGGVVTAPIEHAFVKLDLKNPKMIKIVEFLDRCFELAR